MTEFTENNPHLEEVKRLDESEKLLRLRIRLDQERLSKIGGEVDVEKVKALMFALKESGAGACFNAGRWVCGRDDKEREVGIVPTEDIKYLFRKQHINYLDKDLVHIEPYCLPHFPQNSNRVGEDELTSEVLETNGRVVRVLDGEDITDVSILLNRFYRGMFDYYNLPLPTLMQLDSRRQIIEAYTFLKDPTRVKIKV